MGSEGRCMTQCCPQIGPVCYPEYTGRRQPVRVFLFTDWGKRPNFSTSGGRFPLVLLMMTRCITLSS